MGSAQANELGCNNGVFNRRRKILKENFRNIFLYFRHPEFKISLFWKILIQSKTEGIFFHVHIVMVHVNYNEFGRPNSSPGVWATIMINMIPQSLAILEIQPFFFNLYFQ